MFKVRFFCGMFCLLGFYGFCSFLVVLGFVGFGFVWFCVFGVFLRGGSVCFCFFFIWLVFVLFSKKGSLQNSDASVSAGKTLVCLCSPFLAQCVQS